MVLLSCYCLLLPPTPSPPPISLLSLSLSSPPNLPELQELVKLHGDRSHENEEPLTDDEVLIVKVTKSSCYNCGPIRVF